MSNNVHCESKKTVPVLFVWYRNFGKCWSIFKILSLSDKNHIDVVDFVSYLTTSM